MRIFIEQKNKYILATIQLANRIYHGEIIPVKEFEREILKEIGDDNTGVGLEYITRLKSDYNIFDLSDKSRIRLCADAPIPIMASLAEKVWLKNILGDDRLRLFMDDCLIGKLAERLQDIPDIRLHEFIDVRGLAHTADVMDKEFIEKFRIAACAICEGRYLIYSNISRDGTVYQDEKAVPYKIEYSIIQQRFRLSMWSVREKRPVKANISSMFNVSTGELVEERQYDSVKEMLGSRKSSAPIVLKIFNRNNSIERASLLFSQYDRISRWENENTLVMEINYHSFDEEEIIYNILSFGPTAVVISPPNVKEKIKSIISSAGHA